MRMKLTTGSTYTYDVSNSMVIGTGKPMVVPMSYSMKVGKITKGVADVLMTMNSPMSKKPEIQTVKMDSRGMVDGQGGMESLGNVRLPERALKVGETWKATQSSGQGARSMTLDTVYTFRGVQAVGKISCAVLDVKSTSKGTMASTTTGKIYIDSANGMLYQTTLAMTMTMTQGAKTQTVKNNTTIKRK